MSTTIDSLQIEIKSNSNGAATSIDELAKALKKLNKNGDVSDAVNNLNGLRKSLHAFANIPSSASKIDSLANSLKSLKKIGSIDLGNSLGSIKKAMESLKTVDVGGVAPQIESIAGALKPLNDVKGSGFNAMMNGLKKLDVVTTAMDTQAIDRFVAKIKELDEKLEPVSAKLVAIGNAFKGVNSKALTASGGFNVFGGHVNTTTLNLQSMISVAQNVKAALQPIINLLKNTIGQAIEWDGIEYQFGNAFGEQADEYYAKITEITDALKINKQMFMENSAMAASMLKGFGVGSEDAREMGLGYTELAYDIWAAYNNVYKTLDGADGAMAAVRSAIAGEVEPIRRAGFTIVDSQLKITAANHNLAYSSDKATEAQKSYLRYLTLVDQAKAKGIVGTYASEMDKAEGMIRTFRQQLTSLAQTFGSLFLPILVKVMPWLQAFVDLLGDAVMAIANFFGVDIQKVDFSDSFGGYSDSANEATESINGTTGALKELKNATLGFDELNVISPNTGSGSGAGSAGPNDGYDGLDIKSLWDKSIYDDIQNQTDKLKQKIKDMLPTVGLLSTALGGLTVAKLLTGIDEAANKMTKLSKGLSVASIAIAVGAIVWDLTGAYLDSGSLLTWLAALGTTAIGTGLAYKFGGKGGAGFTLLVSGVAMLGRLVFDLKEGTVDFGDSQTWVTMLTGGIETVVGGVISWKVLGPIIKKAFSTLSTKIAGWFAAGGATALFAKIETVLASIPVWGWIAAAVVALVAGAITMATADFDFTEIGEKIGYYLGLAFKYTTPVGWVITLGGWVVDAVKGAIEWVRQFGSFGEFAEAMVEGLASWMTKLDKRYNDFIDSGRRIVDGILEGIKKGWNNLMSNLGEFFTGLWNGFCKAFGIASPAKKMIPIGTYIVEGIWSGITGAFNWIVEKVRTWAKDLISKITEAMKPSAISDRLSTLWTNAKNWWNNSKSALSTYTPSIGSIKDRLSSAWTVAKNWWDNAKSGLSAYAPNFGSIKNKLESAWETAKTWWNNNVKLSIPSLSFKVTYSTEGLGVVKKAIVNALDLPGWPKLSFAANGGIFDMGSLVWAGEAGPEIVANAGGGKTGVMNVQQMADAVYEGVYSAVIAAMSANGGNNGNQSVNVYLDGKQITAAVEKRQNERGATLMTGGMAYGY